MPSKSRKMPASSSLKQDFLKKWVMGLQFCSSSSKNMSFLERKKAIKLSADIAMASAKECKTCWSYALISKASKQEENKSLVRKLLGDEFERPWLSKSHTGSVMCNKKFIKKILRKSRKSAPQRVLASSIAKRMVKKRTQVLKGLIPGGESMNECSLLKESIDYVLSLQAQVDVMRRLVNAVELLNCKLPKIG